MNQDFDNIIGFWVKDVPYVWVNGKTYSDCKRFYILDFTKFISVFDENNKIVSGLDAEKDESKTTFSIFPLKMGECNLVRNCFLLHNHDLGRSTATVTPEWLNDNFKNAIVKVEGKILTEKCVINKRNFEFFFEIVDPKTNYHQRIIGYTSTFAHPKFSSPFNIPIPIIYKNREVTKKFLNIKEAADHMKLDKRAIKRIHLEALSYAYHHSLGQNIQQLRIELIRDINPQYEIRDKKGDGWRYEFPDSLVSAHILYTMVMKDKFAYKSNDVSENIKVEIIGGGNSKNQKKPNILVPTFMPKKVVYTKNSLFIAQKITRDKNTNTKKILENFYNKKKNQPIWSTNKNANANYYGWFLKFCTAKNPVYVDIGCGSGNDTVLISKEIGASKTLCVDVEDSRIGESKNLDLMLIKKEQLLQLNNSSVDVVTLFHTIHHMEDASSRLKDINRILKKDGILIIKDHDTQTELDAENVTFEHFVYSIGEGEATVDDENSYKDIMPMYYFSESNISKFLENCGFEKLYSVTYKNPTRTYNAVFRKILEAF